MPTLELPCGLQVGPGKIERSIDVKKFSGKVQRDATSPEVKRNPVLLYDIALPDVILKVGINPPTSRVVKDMLQPDRDWLLFQVRRATFGNKITGTFECPVCKKANRDKFKMETDFLIDEIEVKGLTDEETRWWTGKELLVLDPTNAEMVKTAKVRAFEVKSKGGLVVVFRYPNGVDQRVVAEEANGGGSRRLESEDDLNESHLVQHLMARVLLRIGEKDAPPREGFGVDVWDEVDLDEVVDLQEKFTKLMPGVETKKTVECDRGHKKDVRLQATDFLSH